MSCDARKGHRFESERGKSQEEQMGRGGGTTEGTQSERGVGRPGRACLRLWDGAGALGGEDALQAGFGLLRNGCLSALCLGIMPK